jgi:hypothetical protein
MESGEVHEKTTAWSAQISANIPERVTFFQLYFVRSGCVKTLKFDEAPRFSEVAIGESIRLFLLNLKGFMFDAALERSSDFALTSCKLSSGFIAFRHFVDGIPIHGSEVFVKLCPATRQILQVHIFRPKQTEEIRSIEQYTDLFGRDGHVDSIKKRARETVRILLRTRKEYKGCTYEVDDVVFYPLDGKLVLAVWVYARTGALRSSFVVCARDPAHILEEKNIIFSKPASSNKIDAALVSTVNILQV